MQSSQLLQLTIQLNLTVNREEIIDVTAKLAGITAKLVWARKFNVLVYVN